MKEKVCIVVANYYKSYANDLIKGSTSLLKKYNIKYKIIYVPGIFEIPYILSHNIKKFDGFIALGCVIKGETPHFEFISNATINGLTTLTINNKKPVSNGIVTCLNKNQAKVRCDINKKNKGGEAAKALLHLLNKIKN
jgi:6,7-dimethyl-8-ribityllumazine synthase